MTAQDVSGGGLGQPADHAFPITLGQEFPFITRAIYVGGGGNFTAIMKGGESVTFNGAVAGSIISIRCTQVLAGATATLLIGLY